MKPTGAKKRPNVVAWVVAVLSGIWREFILALPIELNRVRLLYYGRRGVVLGGRVAISPNVRLTGNIEVGEGSSIAQNCTISGETAGVSIGRHVMLAPNVVVVAFDHGFADLEVPMAHQANEESKVIIEDDVWIGANVTIAKGVTIGSGSIVGANSFVNRDVPAETIVAGVPAVLVGRR
ncbi:MAG: acyltransferase [Erythrobacter sp.]|nr:acyltransferase [Erythrobacter sp.]